ncbi:Protein NRT1/ PTR FAMILY 5.7, partial [Mucuna pruriens]
MAMTLQENTSPALKKTFLQSTIDSCRNLFIFSTKTLSFIGGLVVSYKFVEIAVVSPLMDYLIDSDGKIDLRMAAVVTNLHGGLSSILFVIFSLISQTYTGCFTLITVCAAASIQGLMLLWSSKSEFAVVYAAIVFLALGNSGQMLSEKFLKYQFLEQMKTKKESVVEHGSTQKKEEQDDVGTVNKIWLFVPSIVGYGITVCIAYTVPDENYEDIYKVAAILMGQTYLLFLLGCAGYRREELIAESNLGKIYRILKAAFGKRKSMYPISADSYYWKDYKHEHLYKQGEELRLSPRVPRLFTWLDKAAIINAGMSPETEEKNGKLCTVKEVREVKSLVPMIYLCFALFAFSLLLATGKTFFVAQSSTMTPTITERNDILILFLMMEIMDKMSRFICFIISFAFRCFVKFKGMDGRSKRKAGTIIRIGFGMVCAVICSFIARYVEVRRLKVNKNAELQNLAFTNSTKALVPQFSLLGMTQGFVEGGLTSLFHGHVANSMWFFEGSFSELAIGSGKLLIIPIVFSNWIEDTVNASHLDRFYLMLGILNAVFLLGFLYYSIRYAYKEEYPQDEKVTVEHTLEHGHQPDPEFSSALGNNNETQLVDQGNNSSLYPLYLLLYLCYFLFFYSGKGNAK